MLAAAAWLCASAARAEPLPYPDGFMAAFEAGDLTIASAIIRPPADACEAARPADDRCLNLYLGAALIDLVLAEQIGGRDVAAASSVPRFHGYAQIHAAGDPDMLGLAGQALGRLRVVQWRYADAEDAFRAAHAAYLRATPQDAQAVTSSLLNIAHAVAAQGRESAATPLYREALALLRRQQPVDPRALGAGLASLATSLDKTTRSAEAEPLFREALALAVAQYGEGAAGTVQPIANLALNLERQGRLADAEHLFRAALAIREAGGDGAQADKARLALAGNLYVQRRYAEAEPLAVPAYRAASGRERDDPARIDAARQLGLIWSWQPAHGAAARTLLREALAGTLTQAGERPGFDAEARLRLEAARPVIQRSVALAWQLSNR